MSPNWAVMPSDAPCRVCRSPALSLVSILRLVPARAGWSRPVGPHLGLTTHPATLHRWMAASGGEANLPPPRTRPLGARSLRARRGGSAVPPTTAASHPPGVSVCRTAPAPESLGGVVVSTEVNSNMDRPSGHGRADSMIRTAAAGTVVALAGIAAAISYSHMRGLAELHGETGWRGHAFPLSVDGIEIVASLVLLADRRAGRPSGWLPRGARQWGPPRAWPPTSPSAARTASDASLPAGRRSPSWSPSS